MPISPQTVRDAIYKAPLLGGTECSRAARRAHRIAHGVIWLDLYQGAAATGWSVEMAAVAADQGLAAFLLRYPITTELPCNEA